MILPFGCLAMHPEHVTYPVAVGCDVKPGMWHCIAGEMIPNPATGVPIARPVFCGKLRSREEVVWVVRQYRTRALCVDCRPEATPAIELQNELRRLSIECWRTQYNTYPSAIKVVRNETEKLLRLDRTITIDGVWNAFAMGMGVVLPQNYTELFDGAFAREMTGSIRVFSKWHGIDGFSWVNSSADDCLHAFNLMIVAAEIAGLGMSADAATMGATPGIVQGLDPDKDRIDLDISGIGLEYMEA